VISNISNMTKLDGIALVTGAGKSDLLIHTCLYHVLKTNKYVGSGIGRDCAIAFACEGALGVAFADINLAAAELAASESRTQAINPEFRAIAIEVDVSKEESVEKMVKIVNDEFGRIDYSVNSAGVSRELSN